MLVPVSSREALGLRSVPAGEPLKRELESVVGNVLDGTQPLSTAEDSVYALRVCLAALESAESRLNPGEQAGGDWAVVEWHLRAGDEPPIHTHTREDETIYVLDGAITAFVADQRIEVEAGSYAALPKNVPHGLSVRGEEARLLVTLEPAGAEYLFVPRDENDADPSRFGVVLNGAAPTG